MQHTMLKFNKNIYGLNGEGIFPKGQKVAKELSMTGGKKWQKTSGGMGDGDCESPLSMSDT